MQLCSSVYDNFGIFQTAELIQLTNSAEAKGCLPLHMKVAVVNCLIVSVTLPKVISEHRSSSEKTTEFCEI